MSKFHVLEGPEKEIYEGALSFFEDLLEYLHSRDLLRKGIFREEREKLRNMWALSRHISLALNKMINLFEPEKMKAFVEKNREFELDSQTMTDSLINQMVGHFIYNIETVLRFTLGFFLKKEGEFKTRMTLGQMIYAIKKEVPRYAKQFESFIDLELRNCLGHGAFWFESPNICYTDDLEFTHVYCEEFYKFWIRLKEQNIRAHALTEAINNAINKDYFLQK